MGKAVVAWYEWQLQGKKDEKKMFVGADCELCKNPDWKVEQRTLSRLWRRVAWPRASLACGARAWRVHGDRRAAASQLG